MDFEVPREAPLPLEGGAGHLMRLKKSNFETLYLLFEAPCPWGAKRDNSNTKNKAHREEPGCEAPHKYAWFCMILWGASYCAFLYKNQTRSKMRCLKNLKKPWCRVMPCLGITSFWGNFGSKLPRHLFWQRGASFLSVIAESACKMVESIVRA